MREYIKMYEEGENNSRLKKNYYLVGVEKHMVFDEIDFVRKGVSL